MLWMRTAEDKFGESFGLERGRRCGVNTDGKSFTTLFLLAGLFKGCFQFASSTETDFLGLEQVKA